ncbi:MULTISPECIES: BspA family leucine-rich repeat surface protein [unclassified Flagellimonas]|uniref:BspA family leucine-rich repeat surface protein n=1 Tax=Flagellimonas sp. MMG031 TaxID=3158549 RepID=A0AAU7N082_9FLAO
MNYKKLLWSLLAITVLWSCGKDDAPPPPSNAVPVINAATFTVAENISDTKIIGTVKATDADGDALTFSIQTNSDNLFEITGAGVMSLATGKKLSFATKTSHSLTVAVTDGTDTASATVTVNVTEATGEEPTNEAPSVEDQEFTVAEDKTVVGTVTATDADDDELTFALVTDESELFQVADNGEISLVQGKNLDHGTATEHVLTLNVGDGVNVPVEFTVTITVTKAGETTNEAPTAEDQNFEVAEDVAVGDVIGTVEANDGDGDELTFALVTDESELFQVAENGEISLAEGKNLDFETTTKHSLTLSVSDGSNDPVEFTVTVTVTNVIESLFEDPASFIMKFNVAAQQVLGIGLNQDFEYDYSIDWGDGTVENYTTNENPTHEYAAQGEYLVAIKGTFPALRMEWTDTDSQNTLVDVVQWGTQQWQSMFYGFSLCENLVGFSAADEPDWSKTNSMEGMFAGSVKFNGDIGNWDTSAVTNMANMFSYALAFNQDIGNWDTSAVTNMQGMFYTAHTFNKDISNWDTSSVTNMSNMFYVDQGESAFNQPLVQTVGGWNTSNVTNMANMFRNAAAFNQSLASWDIGSVTNMSGMLNNCGMNTENYAATLIGWGNRADDQIPDGITLGANGLQYCNSVSVGFAISNLSNSIQNGGNGWTINHAGAVNCP